MALAGRSNVGKSTLLNRLLGAKVAITSTKPQTTRSRVLGIRTVAGAQMIWVDTPGVHRARSLLNRRMVETAQRSIDEADLIVGVVDAAAGFGAADREVLRRVAASRRPWLVALNKIDLVTDGALLPLLDALGKEFPGIDLVPVSAASGKNLAELERTVAGRLPAGPALYPEDELTDQTGRTLVQEFVREQIFAATEGEVPYRTAVAVERFEEKPGVNVVAATILVERETQKRIVIGAGGTRIREIGSRARRELERFFGKRFYLELFVKVRRDWTKSPRVLNELGL
ncbi:MAG: GTPase Era [Deltaproteobacteria bacterium]|nr:GTPase Era [Deltaproteobacteria bacterium]